MISAPPLSLSQIGYAIVLLCLVCFAGSLYLGFRVWNGHVALVKAEHCLGFSLVFQDYRIPVCARLLGMIVIAGRLSLSGFVFKPVSWLAGDSRLRQTFSLRIHLVEQQSLSPICPSTIISYFRSPEASLSTSARRPIAGPIVFSLDRNKPVTDPNLSRLFVQDPINSASTFLIVSYHTALRRSRIKFPSCLCWNVPVSERTKSSQVGNRGFLSKLDLKRCTKLMGTSR